MRYIVLKYGKYFGTVEAADVPSAMEYIFDEILLCLEDSYYWDGVDGVPAICKEGSNEVIYTLHEERIL